MLFIVTYGRSGSTLLQGVLNSIPGYTIRGENGFAVYHLFRFHQTMVTAQREKGAAVRALHPKDAWFGIDEFSPSRSIELIRRIVVDTVIVPPPGTRVAGFKEIRWYRDDLGEFIDFVRAVFPDARFVINTRDLQATAASKWWKDRPDANDTLGAADSMMRGLLGTLGDAAFHLHYDDYVNRPDGLRPLFAWLGEPFDEAAVREVLEIKHSY